MTEPDPIASADGAVRARLSDAARLVDALRSMMPELQHAANASRSDAGGAVTPRAVFEMYERAVRELRAVALDARSRIEQAETVLAEGKDFARRRRRRAAKISARHGSGQPGRSDV